MTNRKSADPVHNGVPSDVAWTASRIVGPRVLIVGNGAAESSLAVGRAGYQTLAMDPSGDAVISASHALDREDAATRDRVRVVIGDLFGLSDDEGLFNTVVIRGFAESHVARALVERALSRLVSGGRLLIVVPYAIESGKPAGGMPISALLSSVEGLCRPETLAVDNGQIHFSALHATASGPGLTSEALARVVEQACLAAARGTNGMSKDDQDLQAQNARHQRTIVQLREQILHLARTQHLERVGHARTLREASAPWPILKARRVVKALKRGKHKDVQQRVIQGARVRLAEASHHPMWPLSPLQDFSVVFPPYAPTKTRAPTALRMATILDTFSQHCFRYEAELLPITRDGWKEEIESFRPSLLLAESAWRGNGGQWSYLMSSYAKRAQNPLRELLRWCREVKLPTVFWDKEDPANFDVFKDAARDFDVVFTTDGDCIERYRVLLGHDRVYALPFAAEPAIHNPVDRPRQQRSICFAGSWRADKYPERVRDSEILLKPAMELGLDIFDRSHGSKDAKKFQFPREFRKAVKGSLDYDRMLTAYRAYRVFLNVNSVEDSPTMLSRRVFELLACGTPVVSSESRGIRELLGDCVKVVDSEVEAKKELERLLNDDEYHGRVAHLGYREVMSKHTYARRIEAICDKIGVPAPHTETPLVSILAATNRPDRLDNILESVGCQTHPRIELILLINNDGYDMAEVERKVGVLPHVKVHQLAESLTLADCLNYGVEQASGAFVAKFDDDDFYGPHYLSDLLLCTKFSDAAVIGKRTYFVHFEGSDQTALRFDKHIHRHAEFVHGATLLIRREVFDTVRFTPVRRGTDTVFQRACRRAGMRIYSADPYNFIHVRHHEKSSHTWQVEDSELLANCSRIKPGLALHEVMI